MIDFTSCPVNKLKSFGGGNGSKISITYNGSQYMLKFPPRPSINKDMSYTNSCISEYISCHIFNSIGIEAQETLLGKYNDKVVVACKDLSVNGYNIIDFASLKNQIIDSERSGYGTELSSILESIEKQDIFDNQTLKDRFWDMFIVDAFVGNFDRHNGNWGYLYNDQLKDVKLCPIYDCGSTLYPQADEESLPGIVQNQNEIKIRIYSRPTSAILIDGKKINYHDFITSCSNEDCNSALLRIYPRIDFNKINGIIDSTPSISDIRKEFYKTILKARYDLILTKGVERICDNIKQLSKSLDDNETIGLDYTNTNNRNYTK